MRHLISRFAVLLIIMWLALLQAGCVDSRVKAARMLDVKLAQREEAAEASLILYRDAVAKRNSSQLDEAVSQLRVALEKDDRNALAWMLLGHIRYEQGYIYEAMDAFEHAATLTPMRHEARFNMGAMLERAGRYEKALDQYELALSRAPGNVVVMENIISCLIKMGKNPERVAQMISKALRVERRPEWVKWLNQQGSILNIK